MLVAWKVDDSVGDARREPARVATQTGRSSVDPLVAVLAQVEVASANLLLLGIVSLLAGIVILVAPRVLNYIVAAYLIVVGVLWIISGL